MALLPGSPAIGAGTAAGISHDRPATTDQRGDAARAFATDIGAFQSQGFTLTPVDGSTAQTPRSASLSLTRSP